MIYRDPRKCVPIEKGFRFIVIPGLTRNPVTDFLDSHFLGNEGQTILYLFDYGDEWRFDLTLEEVLQDKPHPKQSRIIESKGKSPEQYPGWEE
jgi:Plasmid pRiA4b ORF-3-like protein